MRKSEILRLALGLATAGLVLVLTLPPVAGSPTRELSPWCLICGSWGTADLILNMLVFVPLGLAVARPDGGVRSVGLALAAGALLSAAVESAQLGLAGRHTAVADWIANTTGAAVGGLLAVTWRTWMRPAARTAGRLAAGWGVAVGGVFLATSALLNPSRPSEDYRVEWAPALEQFATFPGDVLEARAGEAPMEPGRVSGTEGPGILRTLQDERKLTATASFGPPTPSLAPVIRLVDRERRDLVLLGQDGPDLVYRVRRLADEVRLRRPEYRGRGLLAGAGAGDTLRLGVGPASGPHPDGSLCLRAGARQSCGLGHRVGRGWALLADFGLDPVPARWLDAAWTGLLFLPLGFWYRPRRSWALGVLGGGAGLLVAPMIGPLLAAGWTEAVGLGAGLLAGMGAQRFVRSWKLAGSAPRQAGRG